MKKFFSLKAISVILSVLILLGSVGALTSFATDEGGSGISSLSVGRASTEDRSDVEVINWFYSSIDKNYYFFLPETYDKSALKVWFDADGDVLCDGSAISSGDVTDAFSDGSATFSCGSVSYNVIVLDGGDVASVHINTESGSLAKVHSNKNYKDPGIITIEDYDGSVQYSGALEYIKGRGNSTWNGAKKPYNIKLAKKANLFGMGKAKKWCLLANAGDATFLRNVLSYKFAKTIGVDVTSDTVPVNLYANNDYLGAYLLTEKVEIGENRVDIYDLEGETEKVNENKLDTYPEAGDVRTMEANTYQYADIPNNPENITGGYLLELEKIYRYPPEVSGFITTRSQAVVVKEPEYSSKAQVEYIRDYYQDYENAVYSPTGYNDKGKYYTEYVDVESIARMYIAEEFGSNFDGCSSSFFLYKDIDGKITAGPAWDFDLSFAQTSGINALINNTCSTNNPKGLYIQNCYINYDNVAHFSFLAQLFSHNDFQEVVQRVWNETVKEMYPSFYASISGTSAKLYDTMVMNAIRWKTYNTVNCNTIISNYQSRLSTLTNFMSQRYDYLSKAYRYDTYFVKYDIGEYGTKLVHDINIYNSGNTFVVKGLPKTTNEACCNAWYLNPDYSGDPVMPGDKLTVTGNTNLYAKWTEHSWKTADIDPDWQCCEICHCYRSNGELVNGRYGDRYFENGHMYRYGHQIDGVYYDFGEDGVYPTEPAEGVLRLEEGGYVYVENGVAQAKGMVLYNGDYYYFGLNTFALKDGSYTLADDKLNGLLTAGKYTFKDYKVILKNGIYQEDGKLYYYANNAKVKKGLVKDGNDYYYFGMNYYALQNGTYTLPQDMMNGLLPAGKYLFKDNKIVLKNGIYVEDGKTYYYVDNNRVKGAFKIGDDIYYFGAKYYALDDGSYYISGDLLNGLLPAGRYRINNGIVLKTGLAEDNGKYYYYENYKKKAGAVKIGDDIYYFAAKTLTFIADGSYYISADLLNGLLPAGRYRVDNGIILKTGLAKDSGKYYYYENYKKKAGAVKIGDDIYYFAAKSLTFLADGTYFISADLMNGLLPEGKYKIENGKIVKEGLVTINGKLYYFENYAKKAGAVKIGDDYYYFGASTFTTLSDGNYYISADLMNGILPAGKYQIKDGKLVIKNGIYSEDGELYYYENNSKVKKGLVRDENGDYYYFSMNFKALKNGTYSLPENMMNGLLPAGKYTFENFKIVL